MRIAMPRPATCVLLLAGALAGAGAAASDEAPAGSAEGFTGAWSLLAEKDDIAAKARRGAWDVLPGAGSRGTAGGGFDLPLEAMTDARRLVVEDDGTTLRATYPSGRKRTFVTDGEKRYLDDGDGPATVTARRKETTVTVLSEWFRGYRLTETWELRTGPRRLVVTGKVRGRTSQGYVRTYEPEPLQAAGAPAPVQAPADPSPGAAPVATIEAAPADVDRLGECTIRPPRRSSPGELRALVRVSQEEAGKAAVASLAPLKPGDVISSDVESFEGCLVWPFTMRLPTKRGVQEVFVDAGDGKVVRSEFVPMGPAGETPAP
ncbi:MAG: hypothetical protein KJ062_07855 [Thermoanaerobaculia bacterium]|nr:hypothetical protein [Thermoanaerobaculia bacterium]